METTTSKTAVEVLISLYDWHTKLFHNVLVDITDVDAHNRMGTKANHVAWLAGSLVHGRYELAKATGMDIEQPTGALFQNYQGIQDNITYPSIAAYKQDWDNISSILKDKVENLNDEALNGPDPFEMPGGDYTLYDSLIFCTDRESYCIGQIALYRRLLDYPAMKYD
ncbi:MAG: DinB family protein [Bacteroidota bacterium]